MKMVKRGTKAPARWRLFACGLFLLASCPLPAQAEGSVPHLSRLYLAQLQDGPLKLDPGADLPVPTRISHRQFTFNYADGVKAPIRRTLKASIPAELSDVLAFYRTELAKLGWQEVADGAVVAAEQAELSFTSPEGPATLKLGRAKDETTVDLVQRNPEAAAKAKFLPIAGQARLIFGYLVPDVASLAINDQTIKIAGGENHPQTLDLPPGTYSYELLVSGHPVGTNTITVASGEAWSLGGDNGDKPSRIY
ncbi:hypothetical protein NLM33_29025 [Bradyrhizobium sp. CCGUVB1N3]|uniref:hypothetical protein n=1 Tax=Bradyrhizobium sp. CCGUVB1N3 TaxID=2949629 RepID=UPI0020B247E8|nr:hypothetical protein [Bradyrhizobium sp. CCGUVB1N3]MCP3474363.1 hypothetical protein [Bradyrhizobium sp. CCGUVB1N3]